MLVTLGSNLKKSFGLYDSFEKKHPMRIVGAEAQAEYERPVDLGPQWTIVFASVRHPGPTSCTVRTVKAGTESTTS